MPCRIPGPVKDVSRANALGVIAVIMEIPTHSDVIGWSGTILSIATALTGGFVMIYQRIQRARRYERLAWMNLKRGSLQELLDQANRELAELRAALEVQSRKAEALSRQNRDQLEQIIELTRHIIRFGALIGSLPRRLGLGCLTTDPSHPAKSSIDAMDQTVRCLEGLVQQLRETTRVLGRFASGGLDRIAASPERETPEAQPANAEARPDIPGEHDNHEPQ